MPGFWSKSAASKCSLIAIAIVTKGDENIVLATVICMMKRVIWRFHDTSKTGAHLQIGTHHKKGN